MTNISDKTCLSEAIPFNDFCRFCEKLSTCERGKKAATLDLYIKYFRDTAKKAKTINPNIKDSYYPILRLLLPKLDRDRGAYGIKEFKLANIYVRLLCLSKDSRDAARLQNFRVPTKAGKAAGDFADVAFDVLKTRISTSGSLKVSQVNEHLDNIARLNAENNPRSIDDELTLMVRKMSALEQKWMIRILLKDMKLGIGDNKILSTFHEDSVELYDVSNCLIRVCDSLKDPSVRLHEIEVCLWGKFRPMLAQRCDVQNVDKDLSKQEFYFIETKWDGERFQLHYGDGEFKYFTRKGFDYTDTYGANSSCGILTPYLIKRFAPNVKNCILDGEMMCWNSKLKNFTTKGAEIDVKTLKVGNVHNPCFCAFDILLFNDKVLTNQPLKERIVILDKVFDPLEGIFMNTVRTKAYNRSEIFSALNLAIDNREEGIVLKNPSSVYKPNSRKHGWYKIKPEYTEGSMIEMDVLIIGGYYGGEGRWRTAVTHFLYALAVPPSNPGDGSMEFHSFGRVGSGCTVEELCELGAKLAPHWKKVKPSILPPNIIWTKEKPDLWIEPKHSIILQVKATEAVPSDSFKIGFTLRFPRIQKVRDDKPWTDCLTTEEFYKILESSKGKLVAGHIETDTSPVRKRKKKELRVKPSLANEFRSTDVSGVEVTSSVLKGKEICVITDKETKSELETKIAQHGGHVAQNPGPDTYCIIATSSSNIRIKNLINIGDYTIAKKDWLIKCFSQAVLQEWTPQDLIFMGAQAKEEMKFRYDKFSDSYLEPVTTESLKEITSKITLEDKIVFGMPKQIEEFGNLILGCETTYLLFKQSSAFFFEPAEEKEAASGLTSLMKLDFKFYGGAVEEKISATTTHVIVSPRCVDVDCVKELQEVHKDYNFHVVTDNWINDSIQRQKLEPETNYSFPYS